MKTEKREIAKLKPHPKNPKLHTDAQIEHIKNSILEFGFTQPVVVDENDQILIGHGRTKAANLAGMTEVPVFLITGLTEQEKIGLCAGDNLLAQETTMDEAMLAQIMKELRDGSYNLEQFGLEHYEGEIEQGEGGGFGTDTADSSQSIAQIVILMEAADFDQAQNKFDALREKFPELKDNTEVFLKLLENYENITR